jgi:hypothetical protein
MNHELYMMLLIVFVAVVSLISVQRNIKWIAAVAMIETFFKLREKECSEWCGWGAVRKILLCPPLMQIKGGVL